MARDRPSPYDEGPFFSVARGPVPRERWSAPTMARDRPSPYGPENHRDREVSPTAKPSIYETPSFKFCEFVGVDV